MATQLDSINRPVANIEAPSAAIAIGETKQDITPKLAQLVTGQLLKGEILSKLMDGSYTVRVAGITAKMMLPEGTKAGDQVPLRLIATEPRPTFLLEHDGDTHFPTPLPQKYSPGPDTRANNSGVLGTYADQIAEGAGPVQARPSPAGKSGDNFTTDAGHAQTEDTSAIVSLSVSTEGKKIDVITGQNSSTQEIASSKTAEIAPKLPLTNAKAADSTPDHLSSAPTSLSNTAKFISQILQAAPNTGNKVNIASETPVVAAPAELKDTAATASKLQNQISKSGLFYESHVAEWAQGKRSISEIKAEPQSRDDPSKISDIRSGTGLSSVSKEMGQIIHQQLNVLDQNIVRWHGELFPGQKIDWEIKKETKETRHLQEPDDTNWQSVVRFELPNLGPVTATIHLQSNNLGLSLRAEQSDTVPALKDHASELASAMHTAGSPLMSFVVSKNERS